MINTKYDQAYTSYEELHKHEGSTNYEVKTVVPKAYEIPLIFLDKESGNLYFQRERNVPKPQNWKIGKANKLGNDIDSIGIDDFIQDGTIIRWKIWKSWVFDGSPEEKNFANPLTDKEKTDHEAWLDRYKQYYAKADAVFNNKQVGQYFIRIDNTVYEFINNHDELRDLYKRYPNKGLDRLIKLPDLTPDFFSREERENNTSLLEYVDYNEKDTEEGPGINPVNFSGGYHYLKLKMPGGDTIKFKRYGSMGVNIQTYKIPEEYGGRDDVVFIVQTRNPHLEPNKEWGGMYVIRPRGLVSGD